jgi:localization factor PodJL
MSSHQEVMQTPPPPAAPAEPLRDFTQPEFMPAAAPEPEILQSSALDQAAPYADPAYAEAETTMDRVRIGGETTSKFTLPKLTGRNLRVAALATGVAVIGLVATKGVFGDGNTAPAAPQKMAQSAQNASENVAPVSIPKPNTSAAPIGDYADNKGVKVAPSSEAAKTLNSEASAGNPVAQFQLGLSYLEQGRTDEGVSLIRKSANQNQAAAQYRLAKLYEIGEGVTQDSEMARQLTERAARNGNRIAMHDLALYYAEGRGGVETDLPKAANWFEKAAERGVVDSQFNLGVLFESGQGLPKNTSDAFVWYSIAAKQGDQFAKTRVEVLKETLDQNDLVTAAARIEKFKPVKIDDAANGIFRNVAWAKTNGAAGEKVSQVRQAQTMLTALGYEIGGADGSIGPKTRAAIMNFERANSLPETGRVNTALIDRLELATGA